MHITLDRQTIIIGSILVLVLLFLPILIVGVIFLIIALFWPRNNELHLTITQRGFLAIVGTIFVLASFALAGLLFK